MSRAPTWRLAAAFELSGRPGSVALARLDRLDEEPAAEEPAAEEPLADRRAHASDLLPALLRLLERTCGSIEQLDALVVGLGPGSFTGLRVAAATALGLARARPMRLLGVASCAALAFERLQPGQTAWFLSDARGGRGYGSRYLREPSEVTALDPPQALPWTEWAERLPRDPTHLFADEGARLALGLTTQATSPHGTPSASALLHLGLQHLSRGETHPPESIRPLYLAPFGPHRAPTP